LLILSSLEQGQPLILYVSVTYLVVSGALVIAKEAAKRGKTVKKQYPVYFISEVLTRSKKYYSEVEKICYIVVISARKFRHYFEAHNIRVLTDQPLNDIFGSRDSSGRISKWAMELSKYLVDFEKHSVIKS
jgi:2-C-methyl-D-erythritol 4-phosphate cytidylyltransferase